MLALRDVQLRAQVTDLTAPRGSYQRVWLGIKLANLQVDDLSGHSFYSTVLAVPAQPLTTPQGALNGGLLCTRPAQGRGRVVIERCTLAFAPVRVSVDEVWSASLGALLSTLQGSSGSDGAPARVCDAAERSLHAQRTARRALAQHLRPTQAPPSATFLVRALEVRLPSVTLSFARSAAVPLPGSDAAVRVQVRVLSMHARSRLTPPLVLQLRRVRWTHAAGLAVAWFDDGCVPFVPHREEGLVSTGGWLCCSVCPPRGRGVAHRLCA